MLVYIASPYTYPDPVGNTHFVIEIAERLILAGFTPYIPHLTMFWHLIYPHPVEFWYSYDLHFLKRCDCLLRVGGESKGADREVIYAEQNDIPVYYSIWELIEA